MRIYYDYCTTAGVQVFHYPLPAALELVPYGPGIVYRTEQGSRTILMFKTLPTLDEARMALAMEWTP